MLTRAGTGAAARQHFRFGGTLAVTALLALTAGCGGKGSGNTADPSGGATKTTKATVSTEGKATPATQAPPKFAFSVSSSANGVPTGPMTPFSLDCRPIEAGSSKQLIVTWGGRFGSTYTMSGVMRGVKGSDQFQSKGGPGVASLTLNGDSAHALQRSGGTFTINNDFKSGKMDLQFGTGGSQVKVQGSFTCS